MQHSIQLISCQTTFCSPALTGSDSVSYINGIGKVTALNVLKSGMTLNVLAQQEADIDVAVFETRSCIAACYGSRTKADL